MQHLFATHHEKYLSGNAIVCDDNIQVLRALPDESVDLIYLNPPFKSDTHYVAVFGDKGQVDEQPKDIWRWTTETERTFKNYPFGPVSNALKGIWTLTGGNSSMAPIACSWPAVWSKCVAS